MPRMPIPRRRSFPPTGMRPSVTCGISTGFPVLSPCGGQVAYALLTSAPVAAGVLPHRDAPRLACVKPAASVHPEPGSNSPLFFILLLFFLCYLQHGAPMPLRCFLFFFSFFSAICSTERRCPASFIDGGPTPSLSSFFTLPVAFLQCSLTHPIFGVADAKVQPLPHSLQIFLQLFYAVKHIFQSTAFLTDICKMLNIVKQIWNWIIFEKTNKKTA